MKVTDNPWTLNPDLNFKIGASRLTLPGSVISTPSKVDALFRQDISKLKSYWVVIKYACLDTVEKILNSILSIVLVLVLKGCQR